MVTISGVHLTVVMPALNEEKNIIGAIDDTLSALKSHGVNGEIVVVNDGSSDTTGKLAARIRKEHPDEIKIVTHTKPLGIGASFWDGVDSAQGKVVCMLPADNENEPGEILRYIRLLDHVDMVIPFVTNKKVRSRLRNLLSGIYRFIINATFLISLNYTNGTVLYRKSLLNEIRERNSGFFFQTDTIIRLIKRNYLFAEVPYQLRKRNEGNSKAISMRALKEVALGYLKLFVAIYFKRAHERINLTKDSQTAKRN